MTKSFLITAAMILAASTAWAQQGSTGANSVGSAFTTPAAPNTTGGADAGASTQVQNAGPDGSTGGNNVGAAGAVAPTNRSVGSVPHPAPAHQ